MHSYKNALKSFYILLFFFVDFANHHLKYNINGFNLHFFLTCELLYTCYLLLNINYIICIII